jgi:hypothetical protein
MQVAETSIEDKVADHLEELSEKQIERQVALDLENQEKIKAMENEVEQEKTTNEANINEQIKSQKEKVMIVIFTSISLHFFVNFVHILKKFGI